MFKSEHEMMECLCDTDDDDEDIPHTRKVVGHILQRVVSYVSITHIYTHVPATPTQAIVSTL